MAVEALVAAGRSLEAQPLGDRDMEEAEEALHYGPMFDGNIESDNDLCAFEQQFKELVVLMEGDWNW